MLTKKTFGLIAAITFIIIIVATVAFFSNRSKNTLNTPPLPPAIPKVFKGNLNFTFNLTDKNYKPPDELPTLDVVNSPLTQSDIDAVSSKFYLGKNPTIDKDVDNGDVYTWSDDKGYLVITPNLRKIEYFVQNPEMKKKSNLDDNFYIKEAENFLSFNQIISSGEIESGTIDYLKIIPSVEGYVQSTKEEARIVQVNFKYKNSEYKIVDLNPSLEKVFVRMLTDGKIQEVQVTRLGTIKHSNSKYKLKTVEEIINSSQNAILMSVENVYTGLDLINPADLDNIVVNEIEVVYLLDKPDSRSLQPVYILKATGKYKPTNSDIRLLFYLPALKGY